ncbi:hypothetical protein CDAR_114801 [Caerostris darwini]|uniref:Uncharacterized protein n=1 Tax=Caerostris darwini TaxID=1538125 RepID=A0AAV4MFP6_9ARAC|nr:hypothetical protein CDAR_114801 [Caerostris darwini]
MSVVFEQTSCESLARECSAVRTITASFLQKEAEIRPNSGHVSGKQRLLTLRRDWLFLGVATSASPFPKHKSRLHKYWHGFLSAD